MAMSQRESASVSFEATVERVCVLFTLMIFTVVSLLFEKLMSYHQNLAPAPQHPDSWAKDLEKMLAEVSWWLHGSRDNIGVGVNLYLRSLMCHPHSRPLPDEDAAALNLKGLVINSFSLQLLSEPLRRNESSLPAPWPPQNDCVRLGAWLPNTVVHTVLSQRAVALGDRDTKQSRSTHYS